MALFTGDPVSSPSFVTMNLLLNIHTLTLLYTDATEHRSLTIQHGSVFMKIKSNKFKEAQLPKTTGRNF
jgi:hypothetical protein